MQSSTITLFREENARHTPGVFLGDISLTMSYFHTGIRTIIGAEAFHCPVRDGKEWDHLAMVIRLNLLSSWILAKTTNSQSIKSAFDCVAQRGHNVIMTVLSSKL